jgi:hypothetical protein
MLAGVDENGQGFASTTDRQTNATGKEVVCLNEKGGVYGVDGSILREWEWNPKTWSLTATSSSSPRKLANASSYPDTYPKLALNEFISLDIKGKEEVSGVSDCCSRFVGHQRHILADRVDLQVRKNLPFV